MPRRQRGTALTILHLGARWARDGQCQGPADLHPGKNSSTYCRGGRVGVTAGLHSYGDEKISRLARFEPRAVQSAGCRYTGYAIPAPTGYRYACTCTHTHTHTYIHIYIYIYIITYSMVQSPTWEANWFAASQEIPRILWNPKVHYRTHKCPPPVPILGLSTKSVCFELWISWMNSDKEIRECVSNTEECNWSASQPVICDVSRYTHAKYLLSPTDTSQSAVMSGRSFSIGCFFVSSHSNVSLSNPRCLRIVLIVLYFRFEVLQNFVYLFRH